MRPMERFYYPSTTHPPDDDDQAEDEKPLRWVLLEHLAYVAKRENATTACSDDGPASIQVTLCARRPPRVSYVCVHSPRDDIAIEPAIIATEDDLIVLRASLGSRADILSNNLEVLHYYIYQAGGAAGGPPSLKLLPRPPCRTSFDASDMGVLRYGSTDYIVAGIVLKDCRRSLTFTLYLYDSGQGAEWTTHTVTLSHPQQYAGDDLYMYKTCKVMAIGGPDATMAFVDLWMGILFCDIRKLQAAAGTAAGAAIPILSFVPVPNLLVDNNDEQRGDARRWRNIALIGGRQLKYVELKRHWDPSVMLCNGRYCRPDGWVAATFSRPASSSLDVGWRQDCYMDTNQTDFSNDPRLQLLPRASSYHGPFKRLHIRQPVLGLQEEEGTDIIFFTTKLGSLCDDAWVVAVDMRSKAILGVDAFSAARVIRDNFAYIHSRISQYLTPPRTIHPLPSCPDSISADTEQAGLITN